MAPRIQRSRPPYVQIADHYRDLIARGELGEGERLPTVAEIADEFSVSPGTAHKAVRQLRGEGLVHTTQQGTTVRGRRAVPATPERVRRSAPAGGDTIHVNEVDIVPMLPNVGAALGINADALNMTVLRRQAITYRKGEAYRLSVGWLPVHFTQDAPELLDPLPVPNVLDLIATTAGRRATYGRDYFEARYADRREADALTVLEGSAVLAGTSVWGDSQGPIYYYEFVLPARHAVTSDYTWDTTDGQT